MLNNSLYSSNKIDWETPQFLFDILNKEFNFDLDVCANYYNSKCEIFIDINENSLTQEWKGMCWMNPPYGDNIKLWIEKAYNESFKDNTTIVCLLPVRSDTKWWHNFVMKANEIRLLNKRLNFSEYGNKAPFPCCIVVFNGQNNLILKSMKI